MPDLLPVYDDGLFDELADLTADGRELYAEQGLLRR